MTTHLLHCHTDTVIAILINIPVRVVTYKELYIDVKWHVLICQS